MEAIQLLLPTFFQEEEYCSSQVRRCSPAAIFSIHAGVPLPNGEVQVGVIDADGNLVTTSDRSVAVFFQDLVRGIQATDRVNIFLDNVVSPTLLTDGDPIKSRQIFAQTIVPEPSTLIMFDTGFFKPY